MSVDTKMQRVLADMMISEWNVLSREEKHRVYAALRDSADEVERLTAINKGLIVEADLAETDLMESEKEVERLRLELRPETPQKPEGDAIDEITRRKNAETEVKRLREENVELIKANAEVAMLFCCHEALLAAAIDVRNMYFGQRDSGNWTPAERALHEAIAACEEKHDA